MKTRLLTSLYLAIAIVLAFFSRFLTLYVFDFVVGLLAVMATVEVARVLERSKKYNSIDFVGLYPALLYVGLIFAMYYELAWEYYLVLFIGLFFFFFFVSYLSTIIFKGKTTKEMEKYAVTVKRNRYALGKALNSSFLFVYPTLLFGSLILLNHLQHLSFVTTVLPNNVEILGTFFLLLAVVVTVVTDSMAMLTGMLLKGPKLAPIISPKKTISGAIGGLVGGTASAYVLYLIFNVYDVFANAFGVFDGVWVVLLIGFVSSVACQAGDIFASFLKRRARVKDYGTIFPGHGGVMDRFDGLVFSGTTVLILMLLFI